MYKMECEDAIANTINRFFHQDIHVEEIISCGKKLKENWGVGDGDGWRYERCTKKSHGSNVLFIMLGARVYI